MNREIVPEIAADIEVLKDVLIRELPPECKVKIPLLNRKVIGITKSIGIMSEVRIRPNKIFVNNLMPMYLGLAIFIFLPFGIYLLCKMKEGEALRSSVHDIVLRATRRGTQYSFLGE
ncbi:MAG: hypothetical protein VB050_13205 [Geobacteraceae bacterium]|nr:hypothetical protein [Geobacteraceae bacterium]